MGKIKFEKTSVLGVSGSIEKVSKMNVCVRNGVRRPYFKQLGYICYSQIDNEYYFQQQENLIPTGSKIYGDDPKSLESLKNKINEKYS